MSVCRKQRVYADIVERRLGQAGELDQLLPVDLQVGHLAQRPDVVDAGAQPGDRMQLVGLADRDGPGPAVARGQRYAAVDDEQALGVRGTGLEEQMAGVGGMQPELVGQRHQVSIG